MSAVKPPVRSHSAAREGTACPSSAASRCRSAADDAQGVCAGDHGQRDPSAGDGFAPLEQRVHDDSGQPAERAKRERDNHGARRGAAEHARSKREQRADVPDDTGDACEQREPPACGEQGRAFSRALAPHHHDEHHVEHGAREEPEDVHDLSSHRRRHLVILMRRTGGGDVEPQSGRSFRTSGRNSHMTGSPGQFRASSSGCVLDSPTHAVARPIRD